MANFSLILSNTANQAETKVLIDSVNHQCIPNIGDNLVYNDTKYRVIRVVHDFTIPTKSRILVFIELNSIQQKPEQLNSTSNNSKSFGVFDFNTYDMMI